MLKLGTLNNCERCGAQYSTYNVKTEGQDDWKEAWSQCPVLDENGKIKKPHGVCQFCNPKLQYYNKQVAKTKES
jgi:ribosomal protein L32